MTQVHIYTQENCGYCRQAKMLLDKLEIPYDEESCDSEEQKDKVKKMTGFMTFPQIYVGNQFLGGFDDLVDAKKSGRLQQMLSNTQDVEEDVDAEGEYEEE